MATSSIPQVVYLDTLDLTGVYQDNMGRPQANRSVKGNPITMGGRVFERGIGTHAISEIPLLLHGEALRFRATIGVDDETAGEGTVRFRVYTDGGLRFETPIMKGGQPPVEIDIDLAGVRHLALVLHDADDWHLHDHANWADARIEMRSDAIHMPYIPVASPEPLPTIAPIDGNILRINGPAIVGTTTGKPFLHLIPATGRKPLAYGATGLPEGLQLDAATGIISGRVARDGSYAVRLTVSDISGSVAQDLRIDAGFRKLALTPPMGWNSWNVWGVAVDDAKVRAAADSLVASGLADHGFAYINIDDAWEGERDASGRLIPNDKFPDMKGLADYVHSRGLKIGIYSSPGPKTCGGYEGSYLHELQDAQSYAEWGFDYLKHDWCSYGQIAKNYERPELMKPYLVMRQALDSVDRDIVYSLCQYGTGKVWEWGSEVGGNLWRTTGDIMDTWRSMKAIGFEQDPAAAFSRPGQWNDPDMLVVGRLGWGPDPQPTRLTQNEQVTHISLWALLAAPLLIGCDMTRLDSFTLDLLSNDEVIAIDQDPQGTAARRRTKTGLLEVWSRPLADGSVAVGLFNLGCEPTEIAAHWEDLDITGQQVVRDVWQQKDLGTANGSVAVIVAAHGCRLLRLSRNC